MLSAKGGKDYHQPYSYRMESTDDGHAQQSENKKQPDGEGDSDQGGTIFLSTNSPQNRFTLPD